jgi:hypothetical protein
MVNRTIARRTTTFFMLPLVSLEWTRDGAAVARTPPVRRKYLG